MESENANLDTLYGASFMDRVAAKIVDSLILFFPNLFLHFSTVPYLGPIIFSSLYYIFFEASATQATPGQRIAGLIVVNNDRSPAGLLPCAVRQVFRTLSTGLFGLPYLAVFFTKSRQTAHDLLADTFVIQGKTDAVLIESWLKCFRSFIESLYSKFKK